MNRERYFKVLQQIVTVPESWRQSLWHCRNQHCFAGWAQIMSGKKEDQTCFQMDSGIWTTRVFEDAKEWLEMTEAEASYVFYSKRTLQEIVDFYENYPTADTDRVSSRVTGTVSSEDTGTACISDYQQDLDGVGQAR